MAKERGCRQIDGQMAPCSEGQIKRNVINEAMAAQPHGARQKPVNRDFGEEKAGQR